MKGPKIENISKLYLDIFIGYQSHKQDSCDLILVVIRLHYPNQPVVDKVSPGKSFSLPPIPAASTTKRF